MQYLQEIRKDDQTVNNLFRLLHVNVVKISAEEVILSLLLRDDFTQGAGVTAGGILSTLADEAMAHVVMANLEGRTDIATIEMSIRFFKPVKEGEIVAKSTIKKLGKKIIFAHAKILHDGQPIADADASFVILNKNCEAI